MDRPRATRGDLDISPRAYLSFDVRRVLQILAFTGLNYTSLNGGMTDQNGNYLDNNDLNRIDAGISLRF